MHLTLFSLPTIDTKKKKYELILFAADLLFCLFDVLSETRVHLKKNDDTVQIKSVKLYSKRLFGRTTHMTLTS